MNMWVMAAFQVLLSHQGVWGGYDWGFPTYWRYPAMWYPGDTSKRDFYFDRIAPLVFDTFYTQMWSKRDKHEVIAIGVWISSNRILTAYNPFRHIVQDRHSLTHLISTAVIGRRTKGYRLQLTLATRHLACGRQVQYLPDEKIGDDMWHGAERRNCPLHDLMVFRIDGSHQVSQLTSEQVKANYPYSANQTLAHGMFVAEIAGPDEHMGAYFRYCELLGRGSTRVTEFEPDDNAVVDCEKWLPREWGHFICIVNKNNHSYLGSGAILVSDEKVFGVGSFLFFRGKNSILVFTDVRPYYENIIGACEHNDSLD